MHYTDRHTTEYITRYKGRYALYVVMPVVSISPFSHDRGHATMSYGGGDGETYPGDRTPLMLPYVFRALSTTQG